MFSRSRLIRSSSYLAGAVLLTAFARPAGRSALPPLRNLGPIVGRSRSAVGLVEQLIELPDGRIVLNDARKQGLILLTSALDEPQVVLGRGAKKQDGQRTHGYPPRGGVALRYRGDTVIFANPRSRTFLVIDASGELVREAPFPAGPAPLAGSGSPFAMRADRDGRVVYWAAGGQRCGTNEAAADSMPLLRTSLQSVTVDTVAYTRTLRHECLRAADAPEDRSQSSRVLNHLKSLVPVVPPAMRRDEWALLSDGTVAIMRADCSIDWVPPRGKARSTPQVIPGSHRLTEGQKKAMIDSLRVYYRRVTDSIYKNVVPDDPQYKRLAEKERYKVTAASLTPRLPELKDIPDDLRPLEGPIRVDADDNLWIPEAASTMTPRTRRKRTPPTVYDVVNRSGVVTDRVRIPDGATLVGFGRGVAYLASREGQGLSLLRAKLR